jgi:hypothetical protein
MKKNRTIPFISPFIIIALVLFVVPLFSRFDTYCLEKSKKATWIKPLEKAILTIGKFTYEYTSDIEGYTGTFKILEDNKELFADKVGWAAEGSWKAEPQNLEPFQMITVNPKDPPVVLFYSEIGQYDLEIRIYSTTEPKLLDVLHVGEAGAEVRDVDNDGILEFDTVNGFWIPFPYKTGNTIRAIYHFNKTKFELVKNGNFKSLFLKWGDEEYQKYEKLYKKYRSESYDKVIGDMKDENKNWRKRDWKFVDDRRTYKAINMYKMMLKHLGAWLAQTESTGDPEKIKEVLNKFRELPYLSRDEKKGMIDYLFEAGYTGLIFR